MKAQRVKASRFVLEGLVILLSILVAFGLESWRESRSEDQAFVLELRNVLEEFEANLETMEVWLAAHRRAVSSAEALIGTISTRRSEVISVVDTLVIGPLLYPTVDPSLGGLRTLLASGRLALVQNPKLRLALASWEDVLEDLREEELVGKDVTIERLWPELLFVQDPAVTSSLVDLHDYFWREPLRSQPLPAHLVELQVTPGLINILIVKKSVAQQTVDEFEPVILTANRIVSQIRGELGIQ